MSWIRKQFSKKEYNYQNMQTMEAVEEAKKYQWKKGDHFGDIVEVKEIDTEFTYFTNGSKIFNNMIGEFLQEFIGNDIPFPGANGLGNVSSGINITPKIEHKLETIEPVKSALEELVAKLSKKNIEPFKTVINLNIPNRGIFDMLIENADEDKENLINTIAKVAVSQIEIHKLQEYLTEEVTLFINNYYNGKNDDSV